jgi:tetratricopeptide (TPR) repeat protein
MRQKKLLFAFLGLAALGLSGCNQLKARDSLNNGVRAFRETNYAAAVDFFQQALELDPEVPNAELYLALAYSQQFIPGAFGEENERFAAQAIETFESVLAKEPNNATALAGLATIYQNTNRLDDAREAYVRRAEAAMDDPEAHYAIGSINWHIVTERAPALAGLADPAAPAPANAPTTPEEAAAQEAAAAAEREELAGLIEEGQQHLDRALELNPNYEDAMTFKNLLYRQSAELIPPEAESADERKAELVAMADEWFDRALETRQRNAERAAAGLGGVE